MFKRNIIFKLTAGFIGIVVISTLLIGIIALNIFKNNIYEIKRKNMIKHASDIAMASKGKDFKDVMNLLDSVDNAKTWIVDSHGNIIKADLTYINNTDVKKAYSSIIGKVLTGSEEYSEIYNPYYKEYMMTAAVPIKDNNIITGAVILHSSLTDLSNSMNKFFIYIIFALSGEILLAGFMGYYFSRNITRPIKIINSSALELARGNYGIKTNIYQKDEIGELSDSFDLLSMKLEYTIGRLFEEKTKLNNVITSMSEGILAVDADFNIINMNQSAIDLLSLKDNDTDIKVNSVLSELNITDECISSVSDNVIKSVKREYLNKILNFSISPIRNNLNKAIGAVILIQDISEKEKLEQMRKDFISNVSHEFRTPLTVIKGNLESMVDGMTRPEYIKNTCVTLLKETNRLERMVKDLLNLSRLESGKSEVDFTKLDINMVINDTIRSLKPLTDSKGIDIQLSLHDDLPPLLSDYDKLKQLLIIFLDNGIKFSQDKGKLKVSSYISGRNFCITVEDNGIGIPEEEIQYLGEKFYKADKARVSDVEGTGLGLSIAKRLVKVLNGHFSIKSKLGKGTIITIMFPAKQESEARL